MTAKETKPTILLVHGAWHVPEHYALLISQLQSHGYDVQCPLLPTCDTPITSDFYDDAALIHGRASSLANEGKDIIFLMHSYGGGVGTEAARDLASATRKASGKHGGVVHLIYMCAFLLQQGQSAGAASLPRPDPDPVETAADGTTWICESPRTLFYHDVAPDLAARA